MQQQVITTTVNQPVVQAEGSQDYRVYHKYRNQTSLVLGAVQVVIGLLCIFFNLAAILLGASYGKVAHGFWCGIFFIIGGVFGIKAAGVRTGCLITAFMVFSIINAVLCVFLLSISSDGITRDKAENCFAGVCFSAYRSASNKETREAQVAVNGFLIGLALAEIIFSIWSSAICSAAVCCGTSAAQPSVVHHVNVPNQAQISYITPGTHTVIQPGVSTWIQASVTAGMPQMAGSPQSTYPAPPPYSAINPGYNYVPPQPDMPASMLTGVPAGMTVSKSTGIGQTAAAPQAATQATKKLPI